MEFIDIFKKKYEKLIEEDVDSALKYAIDSFELNGEVDILLYIADALMANEEFESANEYIDKALRENCTDKFFAYSLKGETLFYLEKYKESRDAFNKVIKIKENNFFSTVYLVDIDIAEGKYLDAIGLIDKVLKSETLNIYDSAFMETKKGWIIFKYLGKQEDAYSLFKDALDKDEMCATAYVGLGSYYLYKENYEKAIENYEKAIELGETYSIVFEGLDKAREMRGK